MNRLAWGLVGVTLLVICSGALASAYAAIPDGPTPWGSWFPAPQRWLEQPHYVVLHQTHRTLSYAAALWAIGLAIALWRWEPRRRIRWLGLFVAAAVVVAGALGAWSVLGACAAAGRIHAAMAPLLMAICVCVATVTSRRWLSEEPAKPHHRTTELRRWCFGIVATGGLLALTGVQVRHVPPTAGLTWLPFWAWAQVSLSIAGAVAAGGLMLVAVRHLGDCGTIVRRSWGVAALLVVQLAAAGSYWVAHYGWPPWFTDYVVPIPYTVVAYGPLQGVSTMVYIVAGALLPTFGVNLALWAYRGARQPQQ